MNGKKAKQLRKKIYGDGGYAGPKGREYVLSNSNTRRHVYPEMFTAKTNTVTSVGKRREYQDSKKEMRS